MIPLPELVPARMLNEFAYCPRLAFLEWAEASFEHNTDTLDGKFVHRRVDAGDQRAFPPPGEADDQDPSPVLHARSVMLSDPASGLIAKLDLVELEGAVATPVDYKRGKAPDIPEGAYEPERIQLAAQAIILRAHGFACASGVLYFAASKTRVTIPFTDELVARALELLADMRARFASGVRPPPLVDSPKCPRCSLVGICLPDETRLLADLAPSTGATPDESGEPPVRRLLTVRDEALPVHVISQGGFVGKDGERIVIRAKGEADRHVRLIDVAQLCVYGNVQVSTQALRELADLGIPVTFHTMSGYFIAMAQGLWHGNAHLRIAQHAAGADPAKALLLARAFVAAKIRNQRVILRRNDAPEERPDPGQTLDRLGELADAAARAESVATLLGLEGTAARLYFSRFGGLLKMPGFDFNSRNRRPPRDPVNALLSFCYAILTRECHVALTASGFDPMVGFLHQPRYNRPALALDLMEEFRPIVADSVVMTLVNTGEIREDHFITRADSCALVEKGRKVALVALERRLDSLVTHPVFGYRISYRRVIQVQARLVARVLLGEIPAYPGFVTR